MASQLVFAMAIALVLIALPTGTGSLSGRIENGNPAFVGEFPYVAHIWAETGGSKRTCHGSLITKYAVLTSGYCGKRYKKFTIRLGGILRMEEENNTWSTTTTWVLAHPEYSEQHEECDVAILFFPNHVPLRENIKLVALPPSPDIGSFVGQHAIVTGWGYTAPGSGYHDTLLWYEVMVIPNRICQNFITKKKITSRMLCAGGETTGAAQYDGGAPLVVRTGNSHMLIGIMSFYNYNYNTSEPAVYTRMSSMLKWIRDEAEITDQ